MSTRRQPLVLGHRRRGLDLGAVLDERADHEGLAPLGDRRPDRVPGDIFLPG